MEDNPFILHVHWSHAYPGLVVVQGTSEGTQRSSQTDGPGGSLQGCSALLSTLVSSGKAWEGALCRQKLFLQALLLLSTGYFMFWDPKTREHCGESLTKT